MALDVSPIIFSQGREDFSKLSGYNLDMLVFSIKHGTAFTYTKDKNNYILGIAKHIRRKK